MITGTMFAYYFHCKRHLWLFANHINMEFNSDVVQIGRFISETTYQREKHEIHLDGIAIDYFDRAKNIVHEIKKSDKMEMLHVRQVQYYLYILKSKGVLGTQAIIDYPKLRKRLRVPLDEDSEQFIKDTLSDIEAVLMLEQPPDPVRKKFCRRCAYFELCYS
ncbi:MAG: CRISPR-associated protein Cas4 [Ignavibacteriales bacterium]|nr:MAG: CRISPR-associated protein Cas4 [Ignavibacteriaceae bacterium]MBW7873773.1 CRISPR-associated protein Cas4 [Ignavibacteria bacterium]MCZ2143077.1 CRISPR-associated protein Cas4 [Ignavibacteriales bacterium]OQY70640.1 MAG: CRISPR-associated protein Cas4 [Ignavibacteriales bacterium UTCHB3]MBV6445750.1 hypothetical protein [Ignavibacteriaceae bacterium]